MHKHFFLALIALFLCATSYAQVKPTPPPTAAAQQPKLYRPQGCDTLLYAPVDSFLCSCNCVTFNPVWITTADQASTGLNVDNLRRMFDIDIPADVFQSGRLIGLDSEGPFFYAMFSLPIEGRIVTTRFVWQYMCRSGAFFYKGATRKAYAGK